MFKHIKGPFSKKKKPAKKHPETLRYEELEQRVLFSADIAPGLDTLAVEEQVLVENVTADMAAEQEAAEQSVEQKPAETRRELVFVNENVDGYDQLIADLQGNNDNRIIEVVAIESDRNGIEQVSEILSERSDLAAVHVISHGADGQINLGDSWLNANSLEKNSDAVAGWGNALTETGDILFYGCNLAETEAGQSLINKLSKLTLAEVAASVNLTGDVNKEGDWQLEFVTGRVESDVVLSTEMQQEYQYTLSTYTVSSLADSGPGSIRQAIIDANANGGADIIEFNVAGTVNLLTELPDINSQISIDGSTAPGYAGEPLVILDGSAVGSANGLTFAAGADGSSVHGLAIIDFTGNGIQIDLGSDGNLITGNWIGTTGNGSTGVGNSNNGINVQGANTIIGGTGSNDGNVITNNGNEGINLTGAGATGTIIQGNIIGLDPDGSTGSGNGDVGIALLSGSHNTTIGGTTVEARNVISNNYEGIEINSNNNIVQGNYIGTDITGTLDRGNHSDDGVEIKNNATGNLIGGTDTGAGNLIAFNALDGVNIVSGSGNAVLGNDIHSNGDLDIDLGAGANNSQAAPTLATANATENQIVITGSLSSAVNDFYRIEFFSNSGGIQTYIGYVNVATDGTGNANINATLDESVAVGATIRATAINSDAGYTGFTDSSELGVGVIAVAANDAPINAVPGSQTISQDESLSFSTANGNAITISDTDAGSNEIEVTLSVDNGTLNLSDLLESQALTTVNTTEAGSQDRADLVFAPDGSFVAVWTDSSLDTGTAGVYMQRYDAAGAAIGGQVRVNSTSAGDQTSPAIAMDGSGKFVVTWASYDQDKNNTWGVYAQRFDASGNAIGGEIQVNTTTNDSQLKPDIAMTDGGEFTIIWEGKGSGDTWGIFAQQFDNSGSAVGGEIAVNTTDAGEETYARIGMDATGNFTVTWELSDTAVYAQRFDAAGAKLGGEILVADEAAENEQDADIGVWADGSFVIAWTQGTGPSPGTYVRLYDASGNATSGAIQVAATSQSYPSVLAAPDGGFVVSWTSGTDMMLQRFDGTGSAIGDATTIGTAANLAESTLALNPNGGMGIVWDGNDADFGGVSLARYDLPDLSFITGGWGEQTDLTLSGTMADINTALEGLTYTPDTGYNGTDTLTITTDDLGNTGTGGALTDTDTVTITVGNPNAPVIDLDADNSSGQAASDFAATWTEGSGAVAIVDSDATLTDGDSNLSSITVTITNLRQAGVEYLDADTTGTSLVKNYDAGTGVLTITGSGTTADFQQVLLTVTYDNTSDAPDTTARVITFTATDALSNGNTATTTVSLSAANDAPVFIEGGVGYWQFDEGTGITTGDSAYGTSTGTLINDPTWTTGQFGQALQFNGVDDYVEIADAPELDISGAEFSASFWVKPDPGGPGTEDMFFMKGDRTGNSNVNYYLSWKSSGYITWAFKSDGYFEYLDMDVPLPTEGVWNHIAIVFNQPDVSLYINGNEYTYINVATGGTMNKPLVSNDEPLWIGAGRKDGSLVAPGENSGPFAGAIDELAIYDRALTAAEVETIRVSQPAAATADNFSIAENSANGTVVGKVAASDRDIGDTLTYTITGGNTGGAFSIDANGQIKVANSMALDFETNPTFNLTIEATDDGSPNLSDTMTVAITLNNVNDAPIARPDGVHLSFDGDDFIQVADAPSLQMTSNVTIEAWINHDDTDTGSKIIVNKEGEYEVGITAETGEIKFAFANQGTPDNWAWHNTGYFVTAGEWTHVAVTYDGVAGEAKTYINGELVDTFAQSGDLGDVYPTFNELWIGGRQNDPADRFKGQIDEVRVWSSTRTQGEIQASMGGQLTGGESGLAGNWRLDEAFGSVAIDQSASGNDGILGGSEGAAATPTYQGYSISEDSLLTVPAGTGLLANDFDADGDILTVTNVDTTGMLGSLVVNAADGSFTYDPQGVLDSLGAGERLRETFTYTANDGSVDSSPVTVTIMVVGVNDAATVSSATVALDETDAALSTSGTLTSSDVDNPDDTFAAGTTVGTIGTFSIDAAGAWNFIANSAFDSLNVGDSVSETYNVTSVDGTTSTVQITITGTDDAAVVSGTTTGAVTEANIGDAAVTATGTISISDVDADDTPSFADVAATAGDNNYGSFVLSSGTWTYTLDQSAVQDLDADDTVTDMITYTATDATTQQITITITGTDDAAVVSGTTTGAVTEGNIGDAAVTATGTISIADADADDAPSFADVGATAGDNNYGSFVLSSGTWTYTLDQTAVQDLDAGDIVNDTITYTATDGTTQVVTITITGTDDAAVVSGTTTGAVTEANIGDAAVTATGTISIADADADDAPSFADVGATAGDNNYGSFVLSSGTWTYTLDQSAVQDLDADDTVTDTITYTATDATTQQITITITGTDDAAVVSGTTTGAVTEANIGDAAVTATGTISIADADADDAPSFADVGATAGDNNYGSFVLSSGTWTYTLDQTAVQDLDAGDIVNDTITYTATDATTQQITITITGTDDAAVVSGTTTGAVTEANIGDAAVTATGTISISDVDADDTPSFADVAATAGDNNYGSFVLSSGTWTYTLDQSAVQDLDADDTVTDTITYTATDATTQQITITITGTDDAAVVSGTTTGAVTEANIGDAAVTATGTISIADADADDAPSFADVGATAGDNNYGSFVLSSGTWTYTLDQTAVQDLDAGDIVNDTITYTATDATTQQITITITGTDDAAVVSGTTTGAVTEGNIGDAAVTATGTISIADADADDAPSFADVGATAGDNNYGSFVLSSGTWTYTLDQTAVQDLDAGDIVNDTITYTATDGTTQVVTITITGTDDTPVVSGTFIGSVTEGNIGDAAVTATGTISISDADANDSPSFADVASTSGDNAYGSFVLSSGTWTYTLDQTAVQDLDAGDIVNDTITYTATDGTTQVVTITITGTDDTPVVSGTFIGSVTEGNIGDAAVTATGTISISDADANDSPSFADVASTSGDNAYGSFVLSSGTWTYTLDQTAVQDLDAGDIVNDTITYTATDGTTQVVTITITGTDDAAVVSGTTTGAVTEGNIGDAAVTATGTISIADADADDAPSFADVGATAGDNNYGSFVLSSGTWTYTLDQTAVQDLDAGDIVNDTITYTATDGTTQVVTITITGTDDTPVVSGTFIGSVTEGNIGDAAVTATGTISISDADANDSPSFADVASTSGDNAYGSFVLSSGTWTYTLDQTAVQDLDAGDIVNDTITYTATDATTQQITITITGTDDAAVVSGTTTGAVTEANIGDAAVTATGTISISDVDADDTPSFADVAATAGDNNYGSFVLSSGTWTYTLDQSAVQDLDADDTVTDTITYTATDATTQQITITITGTDDAAVVSGTTTGAVTEGNIGDAAVTATGTISIADADADDAPSFADVSSTAGDNNYGSFVLSSGTWTYTLDQSAVQDLDADDTVTDTITYTATDATTQQITITITGTDDAAVVSGTTTGAVTEGNIGDAAVTATGTISIADADADDAPSFADVGATAGDNNYGSFVLSSGTWTYTLDQSAVQDLDADDTVTDTITYTATDATTQQITITISGTDDAAVVSGTTTGAVTEDGNLNANGNLTITDVDTSDNPISFPDETIILADNGYGDFVLTGGTWTYSLNNAHAAVQALDVGETLTDTHTFTASDGSTQLVTMTINGAEDASVLGGVAAGAVIEDGALTGSGAITITDVDTADNPVNWVDEAVTAGDNGYGTFEISAGTWTYTLNNAHAAVQALDVGESLTDTTIFTASNGNTQLVTMTINGAEDAPIADNADSDLRGSTNPDPELFEDPEKNEDEDPGVEVPTYEDPEEDPVVVDEHALPVEKNLTLLGSADVENQLVYIEDPQVDTTEEIIYLTDEIDTDIQSKKRDDDHSYIFYDNDLYKDISPSKYLAINYTAADGPILKSGDNLSILDFDSDDPNQVEVNGDYDLHRQEIDESFDTELKSQAIQAKIVTISAASFAAGFVSYLLRAGSFVSSLMSSLPLWRGFDPIAIFSGKKKKQKDRNEIPNKNEAKSETLFDGEAE